MASENADSEELNLSNRTTQGGSRGNLAKRLLLAGVLTALAIYAIFFSPSWFYLFVVELFVIAGTYEYIEMLAERQIVLNRLVCFVLAAAFPLSHYLAPDSLFIAGAILCLFLLHFSNEDFSHSVRQIGLSLLGILWIGWLFSFLVKLRYLPHGAAWAFFVIFVVKMGDSGGYFVGTSVGKTKMTPYLSPSKTWEGALGQLLTCIVCALFSKIYLPHVSFLHLFLLGIALGIISQLGDLVESLVKRGLGAKDSGFIPGLGGILDIVDSVLFAIPLVYFYVARTSGIS